MSYHAVVVRPSTFVPNAGTRIQTPMTVGLDPLALQFVIWSQTANGPVLDIACGDAAATIALLARGGRVVAVDADPTALHRLVERVPAEQCRRLKVRLGELPNIDFKSANFAAIHAARVLHLLDSESRQVSLGKFFRWLYPHGKLFASAPMDEQILTRELDLAGFVVEDSSTYGVIAHCA